jgi:hypothetical protein
MRMRIVFPAVGIMAGVNGQRVRQPLVRRELLGERMRQRDLVIGRQVAWKREVGAQIQATVGSLEQIGSIPVLARIVSNPRRHVIGFRVKSIITFWFVVLVGARDVGVRRAGARTTGARP